jgi:predicted metalloprotease with PDZ domain
MTGETALPAYRISFPNLHSRLIDVEMRFHASEPQLILNLPAWIPGSYMIRDFARNIVSLHVTSGGNAPDVTKLDKQSWQLNGCEGEVSVHYQVYANDLSVRSAHVDNTHAYFNGTSLFLRLEGSEHEPHLVTIRPSEQLPASTRVATSMPAVRTDTHGFGDYSAHNYEALIDYPVEIAELDECRFSVNDIEHRVAIYGQHECDFDRLAGDLERICKVHAELFDELPIGQYLFLVTVVGDGYGGLEHRDSTSLICSRKELPFRQPGPDQGVSKEYRRFLGLCSHEYFHLWNVKRIRPEALKRARLDQESHTSLLWAFEGITSYYDDLALARSGVIEPEAYLEQLCEIVTRVMRGRGRFRQSVAESSFDAWTRFYKQDENAPNAIVSYYAKGALVALGLDVTLRRLSGDNLSLDDLMRKLWREYGHPDIGVPEEGVEKAAEELLDQSLQDFFERYVHGTEEVPLEAWFGALGIGYRLRPAKSLADMGGVPEKPSEDPPKAEPVLGSRVVDNKGAAELVALFEGGAAQKAGLAAGDRIIAVDGLQVDGQSVHDAIARLSPGQSVRLHAFRRDELMEFTLQAQLAEADTCDLWLLDSSGLDKRVTLRRNSWLGSHD